MRTMVKKADQIWKYKYGHNLRVWYKLIKNEVDVEKIGRYLFIGSWLTYVLLITEKDNVLCFFIDMTNKQRCMYVRKNIDKIILFSWQIV